MANYVIVTLDTIGPASPSLVLAGGASRIGNQLVTCAIGTGDATTTGYQMKIWGDVDDTYDPNIKTTEATSQWIAYATSKQIKLSTGDGLKKIYLKIRDDVWNTSSQVMDDVTLDTTVPVVEITGPDLSRISKVAGKNVASFSFISDKEFTQYKIKVVSSINAVHDTGVEIGMTNGSTNMNGTGTFLANTAINCTLSGTDLELASSGDGQKIIKIFVYDGVNWSA